MRKKIESLWGVLRNLSPQLALLAIVTLGVMERIAIALRSGTPRNSAEAKNVADAFASGRGFSDAFFVGSGPTAHLTPTMPLLAGLIERTMGTDSVASGIILETLVLGMIFSAVWLLSIAMMRLGVNRGAVLGASLVIAIVPEFSSYETYHFRYWEGALAVFLQALIFFSLCRDCKSSKLDLLILSVAPGLLALVLPPLAIATIAMIGFTLIERRDWRLIAIVVAGFLATAMLVFTPWAMRNAEELHRPILLRSNLGLELAFGTGEPITNLEQFERRQAALHPYEQGPGRRAFVAEGEIGYNDRLLTETRAWIGKHPIDFIKGAARHARQMVIPDPFEFQFDGAYSQVRALLYALAALSGIVGFAYGACLLDRRFTMPLLQIAILTACYAPFQPMSRYLYINYYLFVFGAAIGIQHLVTSASARLRLEKHRRKEGYD